MDEHNQETLALLKLSMCKGVSNATVFALMQRFQSALDALAAREDELRAVEGVGPEAVAAILSPPAEAEVARELELMDKHRARLVPFFSEDFPPPLKYLDRAAPALLRVRGDYRREDQLAVAIVGSRRCSAYGRQHASRLAADLASMGFTVVSGMAAGIDSAAHRGAMLAKGRTLGVLGCGLARAFAGHDAELAAKVAENGALISELPMEAPPRPGNFPPRNRIISGLSLGVVVVEAAGRSGALITARLAGEQGRAVFAVPGNVDSPTSRGCHALIRDGALLVENARDVVEGLGPLSEPIELPASSEEAARGTVEDARVMALNARERSILEMVGSAPRHIDEIVAETQLAPSIVSSTLLTLEIRGLVQQLAGQRYARR
ncbi:MAG: DNA-processing protein DprA [Planctomycetota bacterium]|jgi:DNA processing protein